MARLRARLLGCGSRPVGVRDLEALRPRTSAYDRRKKRAFRQLRPDG